MEFGYLGRLVQEKFKEYLTEHDLEGALKWGVSLDVTPTRSSDVDDVSYGEILTISGDLHNPSGGSWMTLDYKLFQTVLSCTQQEAIDLATQTLRDVQPTKISDHWCESVILSESGGFHGAAHLVYSIENEPSNDPSSGSGRIVRFNKGMRIRKGTIRYDITRQTDTYASHMASISKILTEPENVLDVFTHIWTGKNRP